MEGHHPACLLQLALAVLAEPAAFAAVDKLAADMLAAADKPAAAQKESHSLSPIFNAPYPPMERPATKLSSLLSETLKN